MEQLIYSRYYRIACLVFVLIPYYLIVFTWWGSPYHSAPWTAVAFSAFLVFGVYAAVEYRRNSTVPWQRAGILALGAPLGLFVLFYIMGGVVRYLSP